MIIHLISCPRTISTAMMYAFAQRPDMKVMDEPFYAVYLHETQFDHPGREEILKSQPTQELDVVMHIKELARKSHVFIKNMASHFKVLDPSLLLECIPVFLIRDPLRIITSYSKVIKKPSRQDIGVTRQAELYRWYKEHGSFSPIVIDSNDILQDPELHLKRLCQQLSLEFDPVMLSWPTGSKPYDGVWAPYWYANVHTSTGFQKQSTSGDHLPSGFRSLYEECRKDYDFLYSLSITNKNATKA